MKIRRDGHPGNQPRSEKILHVAQGICLEEGLGAMTMRRVADAVGISATAIYRHYPNKAALVQAVIDDANRDFARYLQRGLDAPDPWARFQRTLDALRQFALRETSAYEILFFAQGRTDPGHLPMEMRSPNLLFWIDRLRECIDTGAMRHDLDPLQVAITIWAQAHGLIALHLQGRFGHDEAVFCRMWDHAMSHLFGGLCP